MTTYTFCAPGTANPGTDTVWDPTANAYSDLFLTANNIFQFRPGTYPLSYRIHLGPGVVFRGMTPIVMPAVQSQMLVANPTIMAVFTQTAPTSVNQYGKGEGTGCIVVNPGAGVVISDIFLLGFEGLEMYGATGCTVKNVAVDHKLNGVWCWFWQTGAITQYDGCSGNTFTSCLVRGNHHGFMNQHDFGNAWVTIYNSTYTDCRAIDCGCGKEEDGGGYHDWSCCFDLGEQVDVDGIEVISCYASLAGKVGFYFEPESTGEASGNKGSAYIRRNVHLKDCVSENNGKYGGGWRGEMSIPEGEQCNYYASSGHFENCTSVNGAKAGFYFRQEYNVDPLIVDGCIDLYSNIGFCQEMSGAGGTYTSCTSYEPRKMGFQLMGPSADSSNPTVITNATIQLKDSDGSVGFHIGGYFRVYKMESPDDANRASQIATEALDYNGVKYLTITGTKFCGLTSRQYVVHPLTPQNLTGVGAFTAIAATDPPYISDTPTVDPDIPVVSPIVGCTVVGLPIAGGKYYAIPVSSPASKP